jgi:hypothetical protein
LKIKISKPTVKLDKHVELTNTNLTQLERVKSELKQRFYDQNKFSGKTVNIRKHIFELPRRNTSSKRRNVLQELRQGTAGSNSQKCRGSLTKPAAEWVSASLGRRSDDGGSGLKKRKGVGRRWPPTVAPRWLFHRRGAIYSSAHSIWRLSP